LMRKFFQADLKGYPKKTIIRYMYTFDTFFYKYLPSKFPNVTNLNQLTAPIFYNYRDFILNDLNRTGWRSELTHLKVVIRRLVLKGYGKKDILQCFEDIKKPPAQQKSYVEITKSDKKNLLSHIKKDNPVFYRITYFLIRLGWRIDETLSLKWEYIKYSGLKPISITIPAVIRKNRKEFVLETIDNDLTKVIQECRSHNKSIWLFPNSRNNRFLQNHYRTYLNRISQKAIGKRLTPHDFRHSLITTMAQKNMPIRDVMAITGHTDINVVLKYYSHSTKQGKISVLDQTRI